MTPDAIVTALEGHRWCVRRGGERVFVETAEGHLRGWGPTLADAVADAIRRLESWNRKQREAA